MHSKMVIWDLFNRLGQGSYSFGKHQQIVGAESVYTDLVKRYLKSKGNYRTVFANDVTLEWVENNLFGLSLFGSEDFLILEAHKLPANVVERLSSSVASVEGSLVLIGSTALALDGVPTLEIIAPNFWEQDRLLDFFLRTCKVNLSPRAKQHVLDYLEPGPLSYYQLGLTLQNFYGEKAIDLPELEPLLEKNKLDKFEFASLLSQKKLAEFYRKLAQIQADDKSLRSFFHFMQSHLYKILDPSYTSKKSKLSKYDKEILAASANWKAHEVDRELDRFRQLEQSSKLDFGSVLSQIQALGLAARSPSPALP